MAEAESLMLPDEDVDLRILRRRRRLFDGLHSYRHVICVTESFLMRLLVPVVYSHRLACFGNVAFTDHLCQALHW